MLSLKRLTSRGDTIVEVMIALSILGLAFAISYATANHALLQARNAQEHSQALEYVDGQLELLRQAAPNPSTGVFTTNPATGKSVTPFCLTAGASGIDAPNLHSLFDYPNNLTDLAIGNTAAAPYPSSCSPDGNGLYYIYIVYDTDANSATGTSIDQDVFHVYVHWQGIGNLGIQQEELTYKIHA